MRRLAPLAAILLAFSATSTAAAADPDYDGDGVVAGDCRPLDPAVHPGANDVPDLTFEDTDCDGIDGSPAHAIFLMPSGADGNPGTEGQPVATLTRALELARASGKDIYAAVGDYARADLVGAANNGIAIYGGYQFPSWSRVKSAATTITGVSEGLLVQDATGIELQLVTVHGTSSGGAGSSTYGVRAVNAGVALVGATVVAGNGGDGEDRGADTVPPDRPSKGKDGGAGQCGVSPGLGGGFAWDATPRGGNGGDGTSSDGDPAFPASPYDGKPGAQGAASAHLDASPIAGGGGGAKGEYRDNTPTKVSGENGSPGNTGDNGTNGDGGSASTSGAGPAWAGDAGDPGGTGTKGSAGGGGGGGAARTGFHWGSGAGGGQGGHGGRAGGGGAGGGAAGGSFAVYASDATVVATQSTLSAGTGGTGGDGAAGEPGGPGGFGGSGHDVLDCGTTVGGSGAGGTGGAGGNGGAGGGGAGGPSAAFFRAGTSHFAQRASTLSYAGAGGGGASAGHPGTGGAGDLVINGFSAGDFDGDGVADDADTCPTTAAPAGCPARPAKIGDKDGDGIPDPYEDDDGDGVRNGIDACPAEAGGGTADGCPVAITPPPPPFQPGKIGASVSFGFARNTATKAIKFTRLRAIKLPAGATVDVRCSGRKCPRKRWTKTGSGKIALKPFVKRWLPVGTVIEIRMTAPDTIGKVLRYKVTKRKLKKVERCLPPDATEPQRC